MLHVMVGWCFVGFLLFFFLNTAIEVVTFATFILFSYRNVKLQFCFTSLGRKGDSDCEEKVGILGNFIPLCPEKSAGDMGVGQRCAKGFNVGGEEMC